MPHTKTSVSRKASQLKYLETKRLRAAARKRPATEAQKVPAGALESPTAFPNPLHSSVPSASRAQRQTHQGEAVTDNNNLPDVPAGKARWRLTITQDDLDDFHGKHFAGFPIPKSFFVDTKAALNHEPPAQEGAEEGDDDLGYYADGAKRTLTDEEIAIFRHTEIREMQRDADLALGQVGEAGDQLAKGQAASSNYVESDSSLEDELISLKKKAKSFRRYSTTRQGSDTHRETTPRSAPSKAKKDKNTKKHIPYSQRHKRKWEQHVEQQDAVHGSITHRRKIRELDQNRDEFIELEY